MNLFLALLWLLGGVVLFAYEWFTGDHRFRLRGFDVSWAWLFLALFLYNMVRWWSSRSQQAGQRALQLAQAKRQREQILRERREPVGEPDPAFNFTDQPPPPPNRNFTDRPP